MADDVVEGMARAMCWADCEADPDGCRDREECRVACWDREVHKARAAWAYALTRLRESSEAEAMVGAVAAGKPWIGHPEARPESVARYHTSVIAAARRDFGTMLDAFARQHGIDLTEEGPHA